MPVKTPAKHTSDLNRPLGVPPRRVALIMETAVAPRRRMLDGVTRYIREHDRWSLYLNPFSTDDSLESWLLRCDGDGVIAVVKGATFSLKKIPFGVSLVYCGGQASSEHLPIVLADNRSIGQTGAEHLLQRGYRQFGFVRYAGAPWSQERFEAFFGHIRPAGFTCAVHNMPEFGSKARGPEQSEAQQVHLMRWLAILPKTVGLMTSTDALGLQTLEAFQRAAIHVPEQVAVIGADNDETMCQICTPPLSSVIIDDDKRGNEAAAVLDRLMSGQAVSMEPILLPARRIVARDSTDYLAIDDPAVVQAIRFIREHACRDISVDHIAAQLPITRRVLERRFRKWTGRSINDQIVRYRVDRAVEMLMGTDLGIKQIAVKVGLRSPSYLGAVFMKVLGRTPGSFRPAKHI